MSWKWLLRIGERGEDDEELGTAFTGNRDENHFHGVQEFFIVVENDTIGSESREGSRPHVVPSCLRSCVYCGRIRPMLLNSPSPPAFPSCANFFVDYPRPPSLSFFRFYSKFVLQIIRCYHDFFILKFKGKDGNRNGNHHSY